MKIDGSISSVLRHKGPDLWQIDPESTVFEAIELMAEKDIGALPVIEGEQFAGLISEREYTREVILKGKSSRETPVHDIMATDVMSVEPGDTVRHCMQLMTDKRLRHLPVVEEGKVTGIVSIGDLVKWVISAQDSMIDQLESYIQNSYPA